MERDERIGHVTAEDGMVVLRIPKEQVHAVQVALQPCPCKAAKSNGTLDLRERISRALAWGLERL